MLVLFLDLHMFNCFLHLNNACIKIKQEDKMYHAYYVQNSILSALAREKEKENSKQKEIIQIQIQQMEIKLKQLEERIELLTTQVKTHDSHCNNAF